MQGLIDASRFSQTAYAVPPHLPIWHCLSTAHAAISPFQRKASPSKAGAQTAPDDDEIRLMICDNMMGCGQMGVIDDDGRTPMIAALMPTVRRLVGRISTALVSMRASLASRYFARRSAPTPGATFAAYCARRRAPASHAETYSHTRLTPPAATYEKKMRERFSTLSSAAPRCRRGHYYFAASTIAATRYSRSI